MNENSEIINFDSAVNLMSSKNFKIENLASKEQIMMGDYNSLGNIRKTPKTISRKIVKSTKNGRNTKKELSEEIIHYNKNLLILKKSMNYITKFEDSDEEEDANAVSTPNVKSESLNAHNMFKKDNKLHTQMTKSTHKKMKKDVQKFENKQNYEDLDSWIQSNIDNSSAQKSKQKIISVYKNKKQIILQNNFYNFKPNKLNSTMLNKKYKSLEKINTLDDKCEHDSSHQNIPKPDTSSNNNISQKRVNAKKKRKLKQNRSVNRLTRRYSVFDKLSSKKYREHAIRDHLKEKEREEMKECTFKPSINKLSDLICSYKELTTKKQNRGKICNQ